VVDSFLIGPCLTRSQFSDIRPYAPGLVAGEEVCRRPAPRLLLEIDVGERLPGGVADDEAGVGLLDGSRRREAAGVGHEAR
jgi:hypothetical protein